MSVSTSFGVRWVLGLGLLFALSDCGDPETFQTVRGTQLISVRAEPPSAPPGSSVQLELSYFDRESFEASAADPEVEVLWLADCENPERDSPLACLPNWGRLARGALALRDGQGNTGRVSAEELAESTAFGEQFRLQVSDDAVANRVRVPGSIGYGISHVLYALCRGHLELLPADARPVPLDCRDEDGKRVPQRNFTLGYTSVSIFDGLPGKNPTVDGIEFDGQLVTRAACKTEADCPRSPSGWMYRCFEGDCLPEVRRCGGECEPHRVQPRVASDAAELDPASVPVGAAPMRELLWVEYLGIGAFDRIESLISDREGRRRNSYAAEWTAPRKEFLRPVPIWTVVKDNRGGTTQSRIEVLLR